VLAFRDSVFEPDGYGGQRLVEQFELVVRAGSVSQGGESAHKFEANNSFAIELQPGKLIP
jgi:hypothetical protein